MRVEGRGEERRGEERRGEERRGQTRSIMGREEEFTDDYYTSIDVTLLRQPLHFIYRVGKEEGKGCVCVCVCLCYTLSFPSLKLSNCVVIMIIAHL
jgi:hypothetical protein